MSDLIVNLGDAANWESIYFGSLSAVVPSGTYKPLPIPEFTVPIKVSQNIIAVAVSSTAAKASWYFAGYLNQRITTGLISGNLPDSDVVERKRLHLNRISIQIFPKLASTYTLSLQFPPWFTQVSFNLWAYIGPQSDSTENLITQLQTTVNQIQTKINSL